MAGATSTCAAVRESISAGLDNESPALHDDVVRDHVRTCRGCQDFDVAAAALHRSIRLTPARPVPDLRDQVMAALPDHDGAHRRRMRRQRQGRVVLGLAGAIQVVLAAVVLVGPDRVHLAHEVAAFELAIGTAMLLAAARPQRFAPGVLPVLAVTAGIVLWAALTDVASGLATAVAEVPHLLPAIGALVLWRVVAPPAAGRAEQAVGR